MTSNGATGSDVTGQTLALSNCPVFAQAAGLTVFDEQAWKTHLEQAGEQGARLSEWTLDFSRQRIILVMLGQKPSLGYGVELKPPVLKSGSSLMMPVTQSEPAAGSLVAAALTTPCAYTVVNTEAFDTVTVTDAADDSILFEWNR